VCVCVCVCVSVSRNLDEETFECTPEGGEAIMR